MERIAVGLVGGRAAGRADDRERRGEQPLEREVVKSRDDLPRREVARAAEDDERGGVRGPREARAGPQRVGEGGGYSVFTSWPPNWLRSAAATFIA